MDMPWWGYLLSAVVIWIFGFIAGNGAGQAKAQQQFLGLTALMKGQAAALPGVGGVGNAATQRQA